MFSSIYIINVFKRFSCCNTSLLKFKKMHVTRNSFIVTKGICINNAVRLVVIYEATSWLLRLI